MPTIEIKNLKVTYQNNSIVTLALNDVNVSFIENKIYAIVGPSGCGKTTLIRTICGFLDYEGMIYLDEQDFAYFDFKERNLSYVDQEMTLNPNIDIYNRMAAIWVFTCCSFSVNSWKYSVFWGVLRISAFKVFSACCS